MSAPFDLARSILGADFISPVEIARARGLIYPESQQIDLDKKLPDQATLEPIRDAGMMLVAGPPIAMSLLDVRALDRDFFYPKRPDKDHSGWYDDASQKFARNDKVNTRCWIALCKEPIEDSFNKTWATQHVLVKKPWLVPNVAEAAWGLTTYKAVRDTYLLEGLYVRTSSVDSDGDRVHVGDFDADGLRVNHYWDDRRHSDFGRFGIPKVLNLENPEGLFFSKP